MPKFRCEVELDAHFKWEGEIEAANEDEAIEMAHATAKQEAAKKPTDWSTYFSVLSGPKDAE